MSILAETHPTLLDVAKRLDPNGKVDKIVEILNLTNEITDDMVWVEANDVTSHRTTARAGIPAPTWRKLNYGVQPTKSTTVQVTDTMGMLEAYAEVDKKIADLNGNSTAFRLGEDMAHIEGMSQEFTDTLFYGNEATADEEFTGLSARFNSLSAESGDNIVLQSGVEGADNASIWLICWGPNTVHGIYPKGSKAGLQMQDLGEVTLESAPGGPTGGRMQAYRSHYEWDCGLTVRDWRHIVRIQFNQEDLTKNAATGPDLIDLMTDAVERLPNIQMGRPAFYMNRRTRTFLRKQITSAVGSSTLTMEQVAGRKVLAFDGIPVRRCDSLLATETAIS